MKLQKHIEDTYNNGIKSNIMWFEYSPPLTMQGGDW